MYRDDGPVHFTAHLSVAREVRKMEHVGFYGGLPFLSEDEIIGARQLDFSIFQLFELDGIFAFSLLSRISKGISGIFS